MKRYYSVTAGLRRHRFRESEEEPGEEKLLWLA